MKVLENLQPTSVFKYFEEICGIPHGSNNVDKISDYIVAFAKEHHLNYIQDESKNVIIYKDASEGYENSDTVIIQGHMDMVAVKETDCSKDLENEGLDLQVDGDFISAKGTSLGADDGIAVAMALAILADDNIQSPAIEAVFTVNEEIGMLGATALDISSLKGKILLNADSEDEGVFTVSCAGGATVVCSIPMQLEPVNGQVLELRLDGFSGGHSGSEIHLGRANANVILGRILLNLVQEMDVRIITINGGEKDNAIAKLSEAALAVLPENMEKAKQIINTTFKEVQDEYKHTDSDMRLTMNELPDQLLQVTTVPTTIRTIMTLVNMPDGVQRMSHDVEGMVQTSLNLGILRTNEREISFSYSVRSSKASEKKFLIEKIRSLTELLGGQITVSGEYPAWEYKEDSKVRDIMVRAYKEIYGKEPVVEGIHAGLECGIFSSKIENLDCISFGPQMENIHTTNEKLSISSTERTWELLLKTLEMLQ